MINQYETKLNELSEKAKQLTARINVLRAVEAKLRHNGAMVVKQGNLDLAANERFELATQISKIKGNISHYKEILEVLKVKLNNE